MGLPVWKVRLRGASASLQRPVVARERHDKKAPGRVVPGCEWPAPLQKWACVALALDGAPRGGVVHGNSRGWRRSAHHDCDSEAFRPFILPHPA